jgi:aerotaxis receptor
MRTNLPVTQCERAFPSGFNLVSTTDLKGRITYCNEAFIELSGFAREELLGQPHNLVRHPDMPEEAFRDMWDTLRQGLPWTGLVKNRSKNGDHYYVVANVTPIMDNDRPAGYLSVRTEPTREQIAASETLYATMRAEQQAGHLVHRLQQGVVQHQGLAGRMGRALRPGTDAHITLLALLVGGVGVVAGAAATGGVATVFEPQLAGAAVLALAVGWLVAWRIKALTTRPMQELLAFANGMAAGDLTREMQGGHSGVVGRLDQALNQLKVNIRSIVSDARTEVIRMGSATANIAAGSQDLSARNESQAASLEETAAAISQVAGNVQQTAEAARQAAALAVDATRITERSSEAVQAVTRTMGEINESSQRIGEIIQLIDGIAFQTNILALNAAVEAARAGVQGRGFAVVATEVRSLAGRSADAAKEIKQLILNSAERIKTGTQLTDDARRTMEEAVGTSRQVSTHIAEIHSAVEEQSTGIVQINAALNHIEDLTQKNNALVHDLADSSASLDLQAHAVADAMRVIRLSAADVAVNSDAVELRRRMKAEKLAPPPRNALPVGKANRNAPRLNPVKPRAISTKVVVID